MKMPRAVIYTRVSTDGQAENGTSLGEQLATCRAKAQQLKASIVCELEDAGVSGAVYAGRPGMQAAISEIEAGRADTLIIANLSRFSRDREHQSAIKKRVEMAGGRLVFCDMAFEDTPEGDLAFGIMGSFAEYERKVIRARTMKGRLERAKAGIQPYRTVSPWGYHIVTKNDVLSGRYSLEQLGTYQVIEEQSVWAALLFERYAAGDTLRGLCRWLHSNDVPTPGIRGRRGLWTPACARRIILNPVYKGTPACGKHVTKRDEARLSQGFKVDYVNHATPEEDWIYMTAPALVSAEVWQECQERLANGQRLASGNPRHRQLLTGLIRCPNCQRSMIGGKRKTHGREYRVYSCVDYAPSRNVAGLVCNSKSYDATRMDEMVVRALLEASRHPEFIKNAVQGYIDASRVEAPDAGTEKLRRKLAEIEQRERATVKAQIAGIQAGADASIYDGLLQGIACEKAGILAALAPSRREEEAPPLSDVISVTVKALSAIETALTGAHLTDAERGEFLRRIVQKVVPDGPRQLRVELRHGLGRTVPHVSICVTVQRVSFSLINPASRIAA